MPSPSSGTSAGQRHLGAFAWPRITEASSHRDRLARRTSERGYMIHTPVRCLVAEPDRDLLLRHGQKQAVDPQRLRQPRGTLGHFAAGGTATVSNTAFAAAELRRRRRPPQQPSPTNGAGQVLQRDELSVPDPQVPDPGEQRHGQLEVRPDARGQRQHPRLHRPGHLACTFTEQSYGGVVALRSQTSRDGSCPAPGRYRQREPWTDPTEPPVKIKVMSQSR